MRKRISFFYLKEILSIDILSVFLSVSLDFFKFENETAILSLAALIRLVIFELRKVARDHLLDLLIRLISFLIVLYQFSNTVAKLFFVLWNVQCAIII